MKRILTIILAIGIIGVLAACGAPKKEELPTEAPELIQIEAALTVTEEVAVGETVKMSTLVTMGEKKLDDASEVIYEVWEEGKKEESVQIPSNNEGKGIYTAETTFEHDGIFKIQVHVTAEAQHTMPIETVMVGDVEASGEEAVHGNHKTEGFAMHFMTPKNAEAGQEEALTVHLELNGEPLEALSVVRYEIWHESNPDKHDWVDTTEIEAGEYSAAYTFEEAGKYVVVVHVEDDKDLHEHEEHEVTVK